MRVSELDDIEKEVLLGGVIQRARADLNDGRPLMEMRASAEVKMRKNDVVIKML